MAKRSNSWMETINTWLPPWPRRHKRQADPEIQIRAPNSAEISASSAPARINAEYINDIENNETRKSNSAPFLRTKEPDHSEKNSGDESVDMGPDVRLRTYANGHMANKHRHSTPNAGQYSQDRGEGYDIFRRDHPQNRSIGRSRSKEHRNPTGYQYQPSDSDHEIGSFSLPPYPYNEISKGANSQNSDFETREQTDKTSQGHFRKSRPRTNKTQPDFELDDDDLGPNFERRNKHKSNSRSTRPKTRVLYVSDEQTSSPDRKQKPRRPKKRVLYESDDESDSLDRNQPRSKPSRHRNRRLYNSDDDKNSSPDRSLSAAKGRRRKRRVLYESDDEFDSPDRTSRRSKHTRSERNKAKRRLNSERSDRKDHKQYRKTRRSNRHYYDVTSDSSANDSDDSNESHHSRRRSRKTKRAQDGTSRHRSLSFHKIRDPKPFDGNHIEWPDYIKHFEAIAKYNRWSDKQKAEQLVISFDGEAIKLLGELNDEILSNYSALISELNRRYNPAERAQAWKIEFRNRSRQTNESITKFAQGLKILASRAYANMPVVAQEQWVLDQFMQGLNSVEIRGHVLFGHPKNINEAISLAIEYEAFQAGNKDKLRKPINKTGELCAVSPSSDKTNEQNNEKKPSWQPRNKDQSYTNKTTDKSNVECYFCRNMGHYKRDCRKYKWKLEQEAKRQAENPVVEGNQNQSGN